MLEDFGFRVEGLGYGIRANVSQPLLEYSKYGTRACAPLPPEQETVMSVHHSYSLIRTRPERATSPLGVGVCAEGFVFRVLGFGHGIRACAPPPPGLGSQV